jgi:ABC-type phosphate transport system substrate-binding protein
VRINASLKIGVTGLVLAGAAISAGGVAYADYAPSAGDVVGVTGDTPQYALSFLADGDFSGHAGFNSAGAYNRLVSFNATADANARQAYIYNTPGRTSTALLNPTDVLRAGEYPVQRVSSSGAAITALINDKAGNINYIGSSSLPTALQQSQAKTNLGTELHAVQIGTDSVGIATATTTNAPAGLSSAQLLSIYTGAATTWNQVGGSSSATIIPEIPPSSSAIYKTLIADLTTANGGVAPTLGSNVITVEQNDPSTITGSSSPANTIVPFSQARLNLWNAGYFHNPATAYPGGATLPAGVKILTGTASDSAAAYSSSVTDYVIFRQSDLANTNSFEPGGTLNWANTLFSNPAGPTQPFVQTAAGQALIAAAGVTPNYQDLTLAQANG